MSAERTGNPALVAVLSILGILAITLGAGLFLMQKQDVPGMSIGTALSSSREVTPPGDDFDPISWARDGADYPPLQETENPGDEFVADYTGDGVLPREEGLSEPVVTKQPAAVVTSPKPETVQSYTEVRENAYWVQVFSSDNASKAEGIRDSLSAEGLPANVITRDVDGKTWYRVRIGAFEGEGEAEHYAEKARALAGYESSYVVQAPVTRRIPSGG